jgi:hypothetical protein
MANHKLIQYRHKTKTKPSPAQRQNLVKANLAKANTKSPRKRRNDKENDAPHPPTPASAPHVPKQTCRTPKTKKLVHFHLDPKAALHLESTKRNLRRVKADKRILQEKVRQLELEVKVKKKTIDVLERKLKKEACEFEVERRKVLEQVSEAKRVAYLYSDQRQSLREQVYSLERKATRLDRLRMHAVAGEQRLNAVNSRRRGGGRGGVYSSKCRQLARAMVLSGCSREKVGRLMRLIGETFGIKLTYTMSRRTVSRTVLEGGVAAKIQIAHELLTTEGKSKKLTV